MIRQIGWVILAVAAYVHAQSTDTYEWRQRASSVLANQLIRFHYVDQAIDDNFSKRVANLFLKKIDPNKHFFTQQQIHELMAYEYKIDNDIRNATFYFYDTSILRLQQQIDYVSSIYNTLLEAPININKRAMYETDFDKKVYVNDNDQLNDLWKTTVQYYVVQQYVSLFNEEYPSASAIERVPELEVKAREKTKSDLDRRFKLLKKQTDNDYFSMYLDCVANAYGPHTTYLPPEEKEDFDINMSGQLEGIGAVLREEDGYIKVVRIIPGSASWRQGILKPEDIILTVIQDGESEGVSIVETSVREAVTLIRGKKGTVVSLVIKKPDGMTQTVSIVRDIVVIQSTYAKGGTFQFPEDNRTYGYIRLPSFYRDFENNRNRNAADDVKAILMAMSDTSGTILDLRDNGGGSLRDAVEISGFFIDQGPVVQVVSNDRSKHALYDQNRGVVYHQPLIVLVNTFSASASEIVSAALQDYNRAIIIGDAHTFGKGTVQKVYDLDYWSRRPKPSLGFSKITIQEFFRINGYSTQFKGVTPDIIYPSTMDYLDVGEKDLPYALSGSQTTPGDYAQSTPKYQTSLVIERAYDRLKSNEVFDQINAYSTFMKNRQSATKKSVGMTDVWRDLNDVKKQRAAMDDLFADPVFKSFEFIEPELSTIDDDDEKTELNDWATGLQQDFLLNEALLVLKDMSDQTVANP